FIYWWYNKSTTLGANPKGGSPFTQNFSRLVVLFYIIIVGLFVICVSLFVENMMWCKIKIVIK
ncbi:hypothetical protein M2480_001699, partial [Parabacteroides sp. PFB2-12]|uniref:hypothetical protein n=1 Tax=unclassified Parabacteroides TaxID=2649774 RepID=UPI0024749551